jgi:hypothetical protein
MIIAEVVNKGNHQEENCPQVKQWQHYNTYALFSSETDAVIISADEAHEYDFIGLKVEDPTSNEWVKVTGFEIVIKGVDENAGSTVPLKIPLFDWLFHTIVPMCPLISEISLVTREFDRDIGTIVWNNQSNNGILSGTVDPAFSSTPFTAFLSDFTSSGYDMSLTIKDSSNKSTTIQSINAAFGFSTAYDWSAVGANQLTLQELLRAPQTCGSTGCANLTQVTGFSATLSPFDFTATSVPEPAGLALIGLGALSIAFRRNK